MSDVACVCSASILREVRARGLDPEPLVAGLELSVADLEDLSGRIPWRAFVVFAERVTKMLGAEALEEVAAAATVEYVPGTIRRILPRLRDSRPLFTLAARWWGPWVFRGTRGRCEVLPDGRLREIVQILPEYAACPEFLSGIRGTLRAMPRLLHQPDAIVTLEQDGREGEFLITPPPRRARSGRPFRSGGSWFGRGFGWGTHRQLAQAERELEELGFAQEQLLESHRRMHSLSAVLDGQSRRLNAVEELGLSLVRDGGGDLDTLLRDLVLLVQQQLGVAGVRLSQRRGKGLPMLEIASGELAGAPAKAVPLRIADRSIGLLELWGVGEENTLVPLEELSPWIAIALEYCGSKALIDRLLRMIAPLREWRRMERRLEQVFAKCTDPPSDRPEPPSPEAPPWPVAGLEGVDLAQVLQAMGPRLLQLVGDDVQLELCCADALWPAPFDRSQLQALVETVVAILCDMGNEQIRIEARAVAGTPSSELGATTAEILISGSGGAMDPVSRTRLRTVLKLCSTGPLVADFDVRSDAEGAVRVCLPLLAPYGRPH